MRALIRGSRHPLTFAGLMPAFMLLAISTLISASPLKADVRTNIGVDYQIALGGFDFGQAGVEAQVSGESYQMEALITTAGIAEQFFETRFALESAGTFANGRVNRSASSRPITTMIPPVAWNCSTAHPAPQP